MRRLVSLILAFHLLAGIGSANTLLLVSSDQHSYYGRLSDYLITVSRLSQDFLARYPDGKVVLVNNGDLVGKTGKWTTFAGSDIATDHGKLGLEVLEFLSEYYEIIETLGNHEEFDWSPGEGQRIFVENRNQHIETISRTQAADMRILAANVLPGKWGKGLFAPYSDVYLADGKRLRFIGMTLLDDPENKNWTFREKSNYDPDDIFDILETEVFFKESGTSDVRIRSVSSLAVAQNQIELAVKEGIDQVVFAIHDNVVRIRELEQSIRAWQKTHPDPKVRDLKLPLFLGGHEHVPLLMQKDTALFVQAGSNYDLARIELNDAGGVVSSSLYGESVQREIAKQHKTTSLRPAEQAAFNRVKERTAEIRSAMDMRPVTVTRGIPEAKRDLKAGRSVLGIQVADMLRSYGQTQRSRFPTPLKDVVAFFNSSGWRVDSPFPPGPLTREDFHMMAPLGISPGESLSSGAGVYQVSGMELQFLFGSFRKAKELTSRVYSPQISSNLREVGENYTLEHWDGSQWAPLSNRTFLLVMDDWLARNPLDLAVWDAILKKGHDNRPSINDALPAILEANAEKFSCTRLLGFIGEHALVPSSSLEPWLKPQPLPSGSGAHRVVE